jgi:polyisoprenoid-binding protein YceI
MATWFFEPGHTAAMFRARHMMVTYVRGHFKNVSGSLRFDPENPDQSSAEVTIDSGTIWTGEPQRDAHLRSADFLDAENHPRIIFKGDRVEVAGARDYILRGALTIRGVSREVELNVSYLGQWRTPWWEEKDGKWIDKGPKVRAGFVAKTRINRHDFGISWNDVVDKGGVVVGNVIDITIDAEAILDGQDAGAQEASLEAQASTGASATNQGAKA